MLRFRDFMPYWQAMLRLPTQDQYAKTQLCCEKFLLFSDYGLDVYYVPFHYFNPKARIVLVGVTPGWTQMERSFSAAKNGVARGLEGEALFQYIDRTGSFSGPMRSNLIRMLDGIGLPESLGIRSSEDLFENSNHLVHFTSAVSAPIFKDGENYSGTSPKLLKVPKLKKFVLDNLVAELKALPQAMIVPLGKVPAEVIEVLYGQGGISRDRCLADFPHPSGNNGHRKALYDQGLGRWKQQLATWFAR